jgi:alpha-1,3-glucan synthase
MVFPQSAGYSRNVYTKDSSGQLAVKHAAAGADNWRYSTNWASSWSPWMTYNGGTSKINELPWSGTDRQKWPGDHVVLQYWSKSAGSSDHIQHADANWSNKPPRTFPHIFAQGDFNMFGYDQGLPSSFVSNDSSQATSAFHLSTEWHRKQTDGQDPTTV